MCNVKLKFIAALRAAWNYLNYVKVNPGYLWKPWNASVFLADLQYWLHLRHAPTSEPTKYSLNTNPVGNIWSAKSLYSWSRECASAYKTVFWLELSNPGLKFRCWSTAQWQLQWSQFAFTPSSPRADLQGNIKLGCLWSRWLGMQNIFSEWNGASCIDWCTPSSMNIQSMVEESG